MVRKQPVGSKPFVDKVLINLNQEIKRRKAVEKDGSHFVREPQISYSTHFGTKKEVLRAENAFLERKYLIINKKIRSDPNLLSSTTTLPSYLI